MMGRFAEFCKGKEMGAFLLLRLLPQRKTIPVPIEDLQPVPPLAPEHEPRPRLRVALQMIPDHLGEGVEAFSHVGRVQTEMNLRGGQVQHGGTGANAANRVRRAAASAAATLTT